MFVTQIKDKVFFQPFSSALCLTTSFSKSLFSSLTLSSWSVNSVVCLACRADDRLSSFDAPSCSYDHNTTDEERKDLMNKHGGKFSNTDDFMLTDMY